MAKQKLQTFSKRDLRWDYYPMFLKLMDKGCEIEAYMFILSTWNFASFRYAMKEFDLDAFEEKVKRLAPLFNKMKDQADKGYKMYNLNSNEVSKLKDSKYLLKENIKGHLTETKDTTLKVIACQGSISK